MNPRTTSSAFVNFLSLLATPWLLFVSTSLSLYLKNQSEFSLGYSAICLFVVVTIVLAGVFYSLLLAIRDRVSQRAFSVILWSYYLIVPLFVLHRGLYEIVSLQAGRIPYFLILIALFSVTLRFLVKHVVAKNAVPYFAFIALGFIASDIASCFPVGSTGNEELLSGDQTSKNIVYENTGQLPNIYHFIFDEYQTDVFSLTLTDQIKNKFSGFKFFPQATTIFGRTEMSLPAIFTGRNYDFESAPVTYQKSGFIGELSFIHQLKKAGYTASAIMHPVYDFELAEFDLVRFHRKTQQYDGGSQYRTFLKLWTFSTTPSFFSKRMLDPIDYDQLQGRNLLNLLAPIASLGSIKEFISDEKNQSAYNRYSLVHVLIPHFPNVLTESCSHKADTKTSPLRQARCATKLMADIVDELKRLGRFKESLIIFQSDHGARFRVTEGKMKGIGENDTTRFDTAWSRARSRSLLLIKPVGVSDEDTMEQSDIRVSLLDVAPTIIESLSIFSPNVYDGQNILSSELPREMEPRFYYFYNKKDSKGKHLFKMTRFKVLDSELVKEGIVGSGTFK